jgi:gamma-tubulin complex component 6
MQHFIDILQGYIINQIHEVTWKEFEDQLSTVHSLEDVIRVHEEYLNNALNRYQLIEL